MYENAPQPRYFKTFSFSQGHRAYAAGSLDGLAFSMTIIDTMVLGFYLINIHPTIHVYDDAPGDIPLTFDSNILNGYCWLRSIVGQLGDNVNANIAPINLVRNENIYPINRPTNFVTGLYIEGDRIDIQPITYLSAAYVRIGTVRIYLGLTFTLGFGTEPKGSNIKTLIDSSQWIDPVLINYP